jgi:threonine dehydrogenase-like Zn-dependent dehydrogenase
MAAIPLTIAHLPFAIALERRLKAARIVEPRRLEFVDAALPPLDDIPGEPILVRLHAGVLCASDITRFTGGAFNVTFPRPAGDSLHECIGEVVESRSTRLKPGMRVLASPPDQRGMSEYFATDASMAVPLPEFEPRERLVLGQPLGTIVWAARKLPNIMGLDVAVVGQGPIGLMFSHLLANLGARRIIALDKLDYRLEAARRMKATHCINVTKDDPVQAVKDLTGGEGADLVVEAVGHQAETIQLSIDLCRRHGSVLMFGVPDQTHYLLPVWDILRRNIRLIGSVHPDVQRDLPLALDMIVQGRIDVSSLITHRFPFEQAQEAFTMAVDRVDNPIKILLDTGLR